MLQILVNKLLILKYGPLLSWTHCICVCVCVCVYIWLWWWWWQQLFNLCDVFSGM